MDFARLSLPSHRLVDVGSILQKIRTLELDGKTVKLQIVRLSDWRARMLD